MFFFCSFCNFIFPLMNVLVYGNIDLGIYKVAPNKKTEKKTEWVFQYIKYSKLLSVLLEHLVKCKPIISEE